MANHPSRNRKNRARRASGGLTLLVPPGLSFSDLNLAQDADGVTFDTAVIERLCAFNGLDPDRYLRAHEDNIATLIVAWYSAHINAGGAPDATADDLIAEARTDDQDHSPGRA